MNCSFRYEISHADFGLSITCHVRTPSAPSCIASLHMTFTPSRLAAPEILRMRLGASSVGIKKLSPGDMRKSASSKSQLSIVHIVATQRLKQPAGDGKFVCVNRG